MFLLFVVEKEENKGVNISILEIRHFANFVLKMKRCVVLFLTLTLNGQSIYVEWYSVRSWEDDTYPIIALNLFYEGQFGR